jgi:hypothetical protein
MNLINDCYQILQGTATCMPKDQVRATTGRATPRDVGAATHFDQHQFARPFMSDVHRHHRVLISVVLSAIEPDQGGKRARLQQDKGVPQGVALDRQLKPQRSCRLFNNFARLQASTSCF